MCVKSRRPTIDAGFELLPPPGHFVARGFGGGDPPSPSTGAVLCITGAPGYGKSTLAWHLGHGASRPQHRYLVKLANKQPDEVERELVSVVGGQIPQGRSAAEHLSAWIAQKPRCVLVLDNAEDLVQDEADGGGAAVLASLLERLWAPRSIEIVVTTRVPLPEVGMEVLSLGELQPERQRKWCRSSPTATPRRRCPAASEGLRLPPAAALHSRQAASAGAGCGRTAAGA